MGFETKQLAANLNEAMDVEQRISMGREFHRAGRQWQKEYFKVSHLEKGIWKVGKY